MKHAKQKHQHPYLTRHWYKDKSNHWWNNGWYKPSYVEDRNNFSNGVIKTNGHIFNSLP